MRIRPEMQPPKSHAAKPPKAGAWAACGMSMCREPSFCTENIYVKLNGKPVHAGLNEGVLSTFGQEIGKSMKNNILKA